MTRRTRATGVEYRTADGEAVRLANKEVVLSAGRSAHRTSCCCRASDRGDELEAVGFVCLDSPHVGKHLKDHLQVALFFPAPGVGVSMAELGISMGPDALRAPGGTAARRSRGRSRYAGRAARH